MNLFECLGPRVLLDLLVLLHATVTGWSSSGIFLFCKKGLKKSISHRWRQTVRTQFSKDDMESSDSSGYRIIDNDVDGDDGVWVDLAAK
jgi:hypothetical protein